MNISITKSEFDAIYFATDQVRSALEAASDEDYIRDANEALDALDNFINKYKKARIKASELNLARKIIHEKHKYVSRNQVDKMARAVIRDINNDKQ